MGIDGQWPTWYSKRTASGLVAERHTQPSQKRKVEGSIPSRPTKIKMEKNMTDSSYAVIGAVIDRSGSMASKTSDVIGGFNDFIEKQKELPGKCDVVVTKFNTYVSTDKPISVKEVTPLDVVSYSPSGGTALFSALKQTIDTIGTLCRNLPEEKRPGLVTIVVFTDGEENASIGITKAQLKEVIEHQQSKYDWQFIYLGTEFSSFSDAQSIGVNTAWTALYTNSPIGTRSSYTLASSAVGRMRVARGNNDAFTAGFTPEELDNIK